MSTGEIRVPKQVREFMPAGAAETVLGHRNGASRQYRYGNLHIREYDDEFLVHADNVDPRKDALGHLIRDAPEVLVGLGCAALAGALAARKPGPRAKRTILASAVAGYIGYAAAKRLKGSAEG